MADWGALGDSLMGLGDYIIKQSFEDRAWARKQKIEQMLWEERNTITDEQKVEAADVKYGRDVELKDITAENAMGLAEFKEGEATKRTSATDRSRERVQRLKNSVKDLGAGKISKRLEKMLDREAAVQKRAEDRLDTLNEKGDLDGFTPEMLAEIRGLETTIETSINVQDRLMGAGSSTPAVTPQAPREKVRFPAGGLISPNPTTHTTEAPVATAPDTPMPAPDIAPVVPPAAPVEIKKPKVTGMDLSKVKVPRKEKNTLGSLPVNTAAKAVENILWLDQRHPSNALPKKVKAHKEKVAVAAERALNAVNKSMDAAPKDDRHYYFKYMEILRAIIAGKD